MARKQVLPYTLTHVRVFTLQEKPRSIEFEIRGGRTELRPSPDGAWCLQEDGQEIIIANLKSGRVRRTLVSTKSSIVQFQGFTLDGSEAVYLLLDSSTPSRARSGLVAVRIVCVSMEKATSRDVAELTVGSGGSMPSMYAAVRRGVEPEWAMFIADGPEGGTLAFGGPGGRHDVVVTQTHATEPTFFGRFAPDGSFMLGPWKRISIPDGKMTSVRGLPTAATRQDARLEAGYLDTPDGRMFRFTSAHGMGWGNTAVYSADGKWCATVSANYMGSFVTGREHFFQLYRIPDRKSEESREP